MPTDTMKAREIDAAIAEQLMGFRWKVLSGARFLCPPDAYAEFDDAKGNEPLFGDALRFVPRYSEDRNAALLILDKLEDYAIEIRNSHKPGLAPWIVYIGTFLGTGDTMTEAICAAALALHAARTTEGK